MNIQKSQRKQVGILTVTETIDRKHQEDLQRLRSFRLMDDDFLTKCFEGNTECIELVLRIVLDMPDLNVLDVRTQVFVENLLNRSVRLDVLATDSVGRKFNIEIQRADKGAGRKRARYNSSMMDANLLKKGEAFDNLPETYVVFITENDVMGKGKPLYQIERCILETGKRFEDGTHILYVNGAYRDETPIGKLMHDFSCTNPSDMYYGVLADRVKFFKESKEGIAVMCRAMEDMRNQTLKEGMMEVALRMLRAGKYALDEIASISGLSLDEVKKLNADKTA
ncbi:Rpn family recombination-promoting nuclease/putative transposase [Sporofaciens musculi]|uniref:Rpn family recombination-promoting nuclease/putative transposase n=1 Tax=Sporofaciens musculi TaxID=2681861 RepID=UPI00259CA427|nr:Rpn family recombination-promoting nuclease/putative transposase [Sporofaciens musculi]